MNVSKIKDELTILSFEKLPKINSREWLSLEDFQGEIWKDVYNAVGRYQISNYGRLKRIYIPSKANKQRISYVKINGSGYPFYSYTIKENNKTFRKNIYVHRLVGISFYGIIDCFYDHIDINILNFTL